MAFTVDATGRNDSNPDVTALKQERRDLLVRASRGDRLVIVRVETKYGVERIYPVNPAAHALAQLAGTKTLSRANLALARDVLGFEIAEDPRPRLDLGGGA